MPVVYGGDKDCRIQLWNTWGNDGVGAGFEVPANFPSSFYEIKVQFTICLLYTSRLYTTVYLYAVSKRCKELDVDFEKIRC